MKFMKEYKIFEAEKKKPLFYFDRNQVIQKFQSELDLDFIKDVKDMSLEYLDNDLKLYLTIYYDNIRINTIVFSHDEFTPHWEQIWGKTLDINKLNIIKSKFKYSISLITRNSAYVKEGKELRARIKEAYPDILLTTY